MNSRVDTNPLAITIQFRHMPKSRAIKQLVQQQVKHLGRFDLRGGHCEIVIDEMHHWHKGGVYKVSVRLTIPGEPLYVACAEEESGTPDFLYSAIRMVFGEIKLQIKKRRQKINRRRVVNMAA